MMMMMMMDGDDVLRFMKQHVRDLYDHVRARSTAANVAGEWQTVLKRVRSQLPLRVITCCRLAGQLASNCHVCNNTMS